MGLVEGGSQVRALRDAGTVLTEMVEPGMPRFGIAVLPRDESPIARYFERAAPFYTIGLAGSIASALNVRYTQSIRSLLESLVRARLLGHRHTRCLETYRRLLVMNHSLRAMAGHLGTSPTKHKSAIRVVSAKIAMARKRQTVAAKKKAPETSAHIFDYGNAT